MLGSIFEENGSQINRKWQANNSKMAVNKCDFGSFYKQNGSLDLAVIIKSIKNFNGTDSFRPRTLQPGHFVP